MATNDAQPSAAPEDYFGDALRDRLEEKGMSQQALADAMVERGHKFHQATIYKILKGTRKVTLGEALDIAEILDADLAQMTIPKHEAAMADMTTRALKAILTIRSTTSSFLNFQNNIASLLASRDDWRAESRVVAESWAKSGGPEQAVALGRKDREERDEQEPPDLAARHAADLQFAQWTAEQRSIEDADRKADEDAHRAATDGE